MIWKKTLKKDNAGIDPENPKRLLPWQDLPEAVKEEACVSIQQASTSYHLLSLEVIRKCVAQ